MTTETLDRLAIREVVENWAVWRDAGDWDRFRTVWHDDGYMTATWLQAPAADFIEASRAGMARGVSILHFLGGIAIDLAGTRAIAQTPRAIAQTPRAIAQTPRAIAQTPRAIAQTKMTISQRAPVHEVVCDVVCTGRFYDFFEKRKERWAIVLRRVIYEKDRLDPVDPDARLTLDPALLAKFPQGYRHLGYLQASNGFNVRTDMPGLQGPEVETLYRHGANWLSGGSIEAARIHS